jgi:hypothetical protein
VKWEKVSPRINSLEEAVGSIYMELEKNGKDTNKVGNKVLEGHERQEPPKDV